MNSKRIPPFPLSTSAAGPPQPPSFPLPIRAPLSPLEESSSTASTSSDSEIETVDDDVLNGSGSENKSAPVLVRSESMPVARLTEDEDVDVEEDEEVSDDSDGFVVRVPVINDVGGSGDANPDPSSDNDGEDNVDLEESLDGVRALGEKSAKDFFDVEQFSDIGGVSSKDAEHSLDRRHSFDGDEGRVADDGKLDSVKNANETRVLSENLNRDVFDEFDGNALSDVYRGSSYDGNPCSKPKHSPGSDNEGNENLLELGALGENTNVEDFIKNSDEIENFNCKDMQIGAAEMGGYDDVIADSNENQKMEDEDCSVPVDYGKIDSSPYKFDEGGDVKLSEGLNGVSTSLVEPDVLEISFDNNGAVIETQNSVKDEEAVTRLEHASIVSEAKLKSAENDSLLDANSKTGECEKEIEEIHEAEGVESMDEKAKVVEERHASDEQMIKNSEGEAVNRLEHASIVSEAKLQSATNDSLLDAKSKTGECEKEIEEIHEDEGVESMDEKAKVVEERHASDEQMIQNSEGPSSSRDYLLNIKGESGSDEEGRNELHDTLSLLEFLKAMTSSPTKDNTAITTSDASLGVQPLPTVITSPNNTSFIMPDNKMTEEEKKLHEQIESIRVKFLRIVHRLGHSSQVSMATLVLHHLARIEDLKDRKSCSQNARKKARELEMEEKDKLDFSCNILVIGKAGVGKSATINSIFEEEKSLANPFRAETTSVRKIEGVAGGINIQILDTPGLGASIMDQASNIKILSSVKKHMKRCPPDVVLYVDRLDAHTQNFNDVPLLRSITRTLGLSIWSNAIIALTHATEDPPEEGPSGSSLSYEAFVAQRSHVVLQSLRNATGDMGLINPVALVENDQSCRWNREGQKLLPNGSIWRSELLLHCCSLKILSEAFSLPKVRESSVQKLLRSCFRSPPMHFFLSSLLESKDHPKLPLGLGGNEDSDIHFLNDFSDNEEEDEYDQLPPFYPLSKSQIAELSKEHRRAYFAEYDYRVKLLQKKQLKDAIEELKEIKKRARSSQVASSYDDIYEESDDGPTAVVNPAPDIVLPPSFDCDNPVYRYRSLEPTSHPLTGFVLDGPVWDHDCGFDGVRLEHLLAIASRFPAEVSVRLRKDKNDFTINFDSSISAKHGQNGSSLASFGIHTVGDLLSYCLRGETKFKNFKKNKTTVGFSANRLGDTWAAGLKLDDEVSIGKRVNLTAKTGAVLAAGDVAYGTNLEATLMKTCHLIGQSLATFGLSLFRCNGYLVCGGTLQSEVEVCKNSKMAVLVGVNSNKNGKITIRTSSREQLQIALLGLIPIVLSFFRKVWPGESL